MATEVDGRIDASIEVEVVGAGSARVGSGGPVITLAAGVVELLSAGTDIPAPHKE